MTKNWTMLGAAFFWRSLLELSVHKAQAMSWIAVKLFANAFVANDLFPCVLHPKNGPARDQEIATFRCFVRDLFACDIWLRGKRLAWGDLFVGCGSLTQRGQ